MQRGYRCFTFLWAVLVLASCNFFQFDGLWLKLRMKDFSLGRDASQGLQDVAGPVFSNPGRILGWEDHGGCNHQHRKFLRGTLFWGDNTFLTGPPSPSLWGQGSGSCWCSGEIWAGLAPLGDHRLFLLGHCIHCVQINEWWQLFWTKLRSWLLTIVSCGWCCRRNLN